MAPRPIVGVLCPSCREHNDKTIEAILCDAPDCFFFLCFFFFISPLFNQVGKLRTSSHLQLRPGQDKA